MNLQQLLMDSIDIHDISIYKYKQDSRVLDNQIEILIRDDYDNDIDKLKKIYKLIKLVEGKQLMHGRGNEYTCNYFKLKNIFKSVDNVLVEDFFHQYPEIII